MFDEDIWVKLVKIQRGRLQLTSNCEEFLAYIQRQFTIKNPMARMYEWASEELTCISQLYSFKEGMAFDIIQKIKSYNKNIEVDISEVKDILVPMCIKNFELIQPENQNIKYYDYQEDAINRAMKYGRGCFIFATGSGKSLIMYGIIRNIMHNTNIKRTLILVPSVDLLTQLSDEFVNEYGCDPKDICKYGAKLNGGVDVIGDQSIIITNRQFLDKGKRWGKLPKDIDLLLIDEAHGLSNGSQYVNNVIKLNIKKCFGFTGTESDWKLSEWDMKGVCGRILKIIRAEYLQKRGFLTQNEIISIQFEHSKKFKMPPEEVALLDEATKNYRKDPSKENFVLLEKVKREVNKIWFPLEWDYIEDCEFVNKFIVKCMYKFKGNTIILFDHISHGKKLFEYLEQLNNENGNTKKIYYIDGKISVKYRKQVRIEMEKNDNCILVGNSKCIGTGINIKNIDNIGFAFSSGKAVVKIIQAIGRGLRLRVGKRRVIIVDFNHSFSYSKKHFAHRLGLYKIHYGITKDDIVYKTIEVPRWIEENDIDKI